MNTNSHSLATRYTEWIMAKRWWVLTASLIVVAAMSIGVPHLRLAQNYRVFFDHDNPDLLTFDAIEHIYTVNDNAFFLIQPPTGQSVFTAENLALVRDFTKDCWQIPFSSRVDSISNFQHSWAEGDDLLIEDLVPEQEITPALVQRAKRVATSEPLIIGRLLAIDQHTTAINVRIGMPGESSDELHSIISHLRGLIEKYRTQFPSHSFHVTGMIPANNAFAEAPRLDMPKVMPLLFGVLTIATMLLLRSALSTLGMFAVIFCSVLVTVGMVGIFRLSFDPASASAPTIVLTLAVADSIHILMSYLDSMRGGKSKDQAIIYAIQVNAAPIFLTSVTTAIAFLSLNLSESPPYRLLGNVTAFGVIVAWAFSMTLLPALLTIMPVKGDGRISLASRWAISLGAIVVAHSRRIAFAVTLLVVVSIGGISQLKISDKFWEYFDKSMEFRIASDLSVQTLGGMFINSYSIEAGSSQGICDPDFLIKLEKFTTWLRERPEVTHVRSFSDTMKRINMNMNGDDPAYYRLPEAQDLASQYLLLYENSLPYGLDLNDELNVDKSAVRVDVTYGDAATSVLAADAALGKIWLAKNQLHAEGPSGTALMFTNITHRNMWAMVAGGAIGFSLIALILLAVFRNFHLGIISLLPNLTPALMAFGIWGYIYGQVGFAISIVGPLSLGIIVDDTVHFLTKYNRARITGLNPEESLSEAFRHAGSAILVTTIVLCLGFAMLGFSNFRVTSYLGLLTSLTIICAFVTDFFLLPALLIRFDRRKFEPATNTLSDQSTSSTPEGVPS